MSNLTDKVMLAGGDLSALTADEKVEFINLMKKQAGLDHMVMPFSILKLEGKEMLYAPKGTTDELRRKHNLSFEDIRYEMHAKTTMCHVAITDGKRRDFDCGVVSIEGLGAQDVANAQMAATTKAKRRATLSFCGLGMIDESEFDTIQSKMGTAEISDTGLQIDTTKVQASQKMTEEAVKLNAEEKPQPEPEPKTKPEPIVTADIETANPKELLVRLEAWLRDNTNVPVDAIWTDTHKRTPKAVKAMLKAIEANTIESYFMDNIGFILTRKDSAPIIKEPAALDVSFLTEPGTKGRDMIEKLKLAKLCAFKEAEIVDTFRKEYETIEAFYSFASVAQVKAALGVQ